MKLPSLIPKFLTLHASNPTPLSPPPSQLKTHNSELKTSAAASPPDNPTGPPSHAGKIGRLPKDIREQLNRRLYDDEPVSDILLWLNELPPVKELLAAQFAGAPINFQNLSGWRLHGYQRWLKKQEPVERLKALAEDAEDISGAARGLAGAAATIASAQFLELLETLPPEKRSPADLAKMAYAVATLLKAEQNNVRLGLEKERVLLRDEQVCLMRHKHQRDATAIGLRILTDDRAKAIAASNYDYTTKLRLLGRRMFGKCWDPRCVSPEPPQPSTIKA